MEKAKERKAYRRACCDIQEHDDYILMRLEMPGVDKDNLSINVEGNKLIIDGHRPDFEVKGEWLAREIHQGDYHMEYTIDQTIDRNAIEAHQNQGVLTLKLGLSEAIKPRKIEILSK